MIDPAFAAAESGMAAHRAELDAIAENLANVSTVGADGSRYRALPISSSSSGGLSFADLFDDAFDDGIGTDDSIGVSSVAGVDDGAAAAARLPSANPLALAAPALGASGGGDVDPIEQMVALVGAGRAYDADVSALQAAKQMDVEALEIDA